MAVAAAGGSLPASAILHVQADANLTAGRPADASPGGEQPDGRAAPPELRIPLGEALENVRSLALPLAQQMDVRLDIYLTAGLVALPVSPMALRTILLTVLTMAIPWAGKGAIVMTAARRDEEIAIAVTCSDPQASKGC